MPLKTNLSVLRRTRRKPEQGDVVAMHLPSVGWLFARVVDTNVSASAWGDAWDDAILLYIFATVRSEPVAPEILPVSDLLCAPLLVSSEAWTTGRFRHVENRPFRAGELLTQHCFAAPFLEPVRYFDQHANELERRTEPCGLKALTTIVGIDERVSAAFGLTAPP